MSGGRRPRQIAAVKERDIARELNAVGIKAERIPLSGSAGGSFVGDIKLWLHGEEHVAEVKYRRGDFKTLRNWLDDRDLLILCAPRQQPLVVAPMSLFVWSLWQQENDDE
jgi:mevalonate pyrophosphate decarboxylase